MFAALGCLYYGNNYDTGILTDRRNIFNADWNLERNLLGILGLPSKSIFFRALGFTGALYIALRIRGWKHISEMG
ncbi:MAG: hypothetical protein A3D50_00775 [Candidatus Taylorbacteria bacterium RIFCSPHIGHO2_02_FULL_44_12]|uniref:Uncharacterized protein n=1 Tax=Candidatus Taylorbacteria bacterium RIFCSPHIGHO2_02_FULL_44_12 TaxID=1802308 RepID=A0A1G2MM13_9BACT|nr:MAG: hypothetical protein A3D50_00775 [Candidatus Taylorbacteria bacterium RIFCSPHIGHO2_02_FULL_44_12]